MWPPRSRNFGDPWDILIETLDAAGGDSEELVNNFRRVRCLSPAVDRS